MTHKSGSRWTLKRLNDTVEVIQVLRDRADVLPYKDRLAMQRRIDQLTADYLYNVITTTHNRHYLERCVERLEKKGLFPLPFMITRRNTSTSAVWLIQRLDVVFFF